MQFTHSKVIALIFGFASLFIQACGKSDVGSNPNSGSGAPSASGSGISGIYASVEHEEITFEFKTGGSVVITAKDIGSSNGSYTIDGEKIIVTVDKTKHTFIRDGNCIRDQQEIYGKLCKGGKAGETTSNTTRNVPTTPSGTWMATNEDGEFKIEFKPDKKFTLFISPRTGKPETQEATFVIEGDTIYATLPLGVPLVLKFVNNTYESTSFGPAMKFVKQ